MESIYPPERFKSSDKVNLRGKSEEFFNAISLELNSGDPHSFNRVTGMNFSEERIVELEKQCSIDHLLCEGEIKKRQIPKPQKLRLRDTIFDEFFSDQEVELEVLKKKGEIERVRSCEKMFALNKNIFHAPVIESSENESLARDLTPGCDFVMSVFFYKPFSFNFQARNGSDKFRFSQEIQMLGRNHLTELRDKIVCASDAGIQAEVESPKVDISHLARAKETYPSGSFFINDVFFNDMRSPEATDYSKNIIQWAKARQIGIFATSDMHLTKLSDLTLRFGYPYVYLHQGNCEHIMVFADAHMLTINDCLNSLQYPRIFSVNKSTNIMCNMCNLLVANWLIRDYEKLPQSSTFLCSKCTEAYCYKDDKKIGEFKLYPIFQVHKFKDSSVSTGESTSEGT